MQIIMRVVLEFPFYQQGAQLSTAQYNTSLLPVGILGINIDASHPSDSGNGVRVNLSLEYSKHYMCTLLKKPYSFNHNHLT